MMIRTLGFFCSADLAVDKSPRPVTADAAANPAYPKKSRLLNIYVAPV
jgi:hypothetical protein